MHDTTKSLLAHPVTAASLAAALAAALTLALSGCGRAGAAPTRDEGPIAVPVRTVAVEHGPVNRPLRATGVVAANAEYALSFHVGGRLASLPVAEGSFVKKGQLLASLDPTDAASTLAQARESHQKARRDAARARALRAQDVVPAVTAQDAETGEAVAAAALEAATWNLQHTRLLAPEDGWLTRRLAEPGEVVGAGRPVVQLSGVAGGWIVRAAVAERDVAGLAAGQRAEVTLADAAGPLPATVKEVSRTASRGTGTFDVQVRLDARQAPEDLRSGLTARLTVPRVVAVAGSVPLAAVQEADGDRGVIYAVDGGRARRIPVRIAFLLGDRAALADGLQGLDAVVVDGASKLQDGTLVAAAR